MFRCCSTSKTAGCENRFVLVTWERLPCTFAQPIKRHSLFNVLPLQLIWCERLHDNDTIVSNKQTKTRVDHATKELVSGQPSLSELARRRLSLRAVDATILTWYTLLYSLFQPVARDLSFFLKVFRVEADTTSSGSLFQ